MEKKNYKILKEYAGITIGCLLYATALNYFFIANHLAEGGVTGVCLILYYLIKFPVSIAYFLINIPLLLIGWKFVGRSFLFKTIYGTVCMSVFIALTHNLKYPTEDVMLAAIYGGLLIGMGLGIIFMMNGSTGGTDIISIILNKYFDIPIGRTLFIMDLIILSIAGLIFGQRIVMYTLIGMLISSKTVDYFQEGLKKSKGVTIISHKYEILRERIMNETGRGTTIINGEGGYSHSALPIVYCVVSKFELGKLKNIVRQTDPKAFVTITDVSEVLGEGFNPLDNKKKN